MLPIQSRICSLLGLGPLHGLGGSRTQETQAWILASRMSPVRLSLPFYRVGAEQLRVKLLASSQRVLAHTGCVALGKSLYLSGPKSHHL
jgi:hypothetical protein